MMTTRQTESFSYKVNSELAILNASYIIQDGLNFKVEELQSPSRYAHLVTARILFSALAFGMGARSTDIAEFLHRKKSAITYFIVQNNERSKFDKNYKILQEKINLKQSKIMANSLIADIAKESATMAVTELLTVLKEMGIIKGDPKLTEGIQDYLDSRKNGPSDLGGKELDIFSLTGNKAENFSPEKQFNK